jgi:hypothetical protein
VITSRARQDCFSTDRTIIRELEDHLESIVTFLQDNRSSQLAQTASVLPSDETHWGFLSFHRPSTDSPRSHPTCLQVHALTTPALDTIDPLKNCLMGPYRVAKNVEMRVKSWIRFQFPQKRKDQQVGGLIGIGLWG